MNASSFDLDAFPANGAADRVRALIELTDNLADIFEQENLALVNSQTEEIAPLQVEKARLAAAYAQAIQAVAKDRSGIASVGAALLSKLHEATKAFEARAARQKTLLEQAARSVGHSEIAATSA